MEPTSTTAAGAIAATLGGLTLALLGVDYYALLWAFVGALVALSQAARMPRSSAFAFVLLSTLAGAAIGAGVHDQVGQASRSALILASLIGGFGAQRLLGPALQALIDRMKGNNTHGQ